MRILTTIILLLSYLGAMAQPQIERDLVAEAAKAYNDSDYLKSVSLYQELIKEKGESSQLYFNLGNAYTGLENYGSAVLNYRKALKLKPSNREASNNLAYVEQIVGLANEEMVQDRNLDPTPAPGSFFTGVRGFFEYLGSNCWAWIAGGLFIIFCSSLGIYLFVENPKLKKCSFFVAFPALFLSAISVLLSFSARSTMMRVSECVLIVPQTTLFDAPSSTAKEVAVPLVGGTTFRILEQKADSGKNEWVKVWLNDDFTGWLPRQDVEFVEV